MDDLISRQAAIDALDFEIVHMTAYCDGKNEGNPLAQYNKGLEDGKKAIEALPPAQPEPTDINAKEAVYNLAEKIGIHQLFALTVELRGEPIQPEPSWIPVSERLPEDLAEVNVTWVNRNPESYYESIKDKPFTATAVYYKGKWYWWSTCAQDLLAEYGERCSVGLLHEAIEVTAWMPLPTPYTK